MITRLFTKVNAIGSLRLFNASIRMLTQARRAESVANPIQNLLPAFIPADLRCILRPDLSSKQLAKIEKMLKNNISIPQHMKIPDLTIIPKKGCVKHLSRPLRKKGGRNHHGKITVRHRGGGFKRRIRLVDTRRNFKTPQQVVRIEHDPNRSAKVALVQDTETKELRYFLAAEGMKEGDLIQTGQRPTIGSTMTFDKIPMGSTIHNIELRPGCGGQLVRSAGTSAMLVGRDADERFCSVKLPSGAIKKILTTCHATLGTVSNPDWRLRVIGKAGRMRNLGIRPTVRGVAMNPIDHPHGGGKGGKSKGKHSQSPWGKICK